MSGTLLNFPSLKVFVGSSVISASSYSATESSLDSNGNSTDGTKARPMFRRASSSVSVFVDASTICCGETFLKNSANGKLLFNRQRMSSILLTNELLGVVGLIVERISQQECALAWDIGDCPRVQRDAALCNCTFKEAFRQL